MLAISSLRAGRLRLAILVGAALALVVTLLPTAGGAQPEVQDGFEYGFQGEGDARIGDVDHRTARIAPADAQVALAERLGAEVRWNSFGTPHMISNSTGYLSAPTQGAAADVARGWVDANRELFRLDAADVAALEIVRDAPLYESPDLRRIRRGLEPRNTDVAHAVLFRQRLGDLDVSRDGLLGVGVDAAGRIVSAWSSVTGQTDVTNAVRLTWQDAYAAASADVGREADLSALTVVDDLTNEGFTTFRAPGAGDLQYARPSAVPTADQGVRLAWETVVLDATDGQGNPEAYIHFIDAETGDVILRQNRVDHFAQPGGVFAQSEEEGDGIPYWQVFPAYPEPVGPLDESVEDIRQRWCWVPGPECDRIVGPRATEGEEGDPAKPFAWDVDPRTGESTRTTEGNNARTAISEQSPFTPDTAARRPVSPTREYDFPWTNAWFTSQCDPSNFERPDRNRNDEDAATANLFVGHNRIHDWAYYLGWTEENSNLQRDNFGKTARGPFPVGREEDPETGQSQAGRGNPAFLGRDNANQITLQDGIPGITNQYLWQPLQAGFYAPCVDGAYDMSIVGHEVGHAIQNRMTGGPNQGLGGAMGRSMGESWSDLTAMEYGTAHGFVPVGNESPFAVGPYATGDPWAAIRNYNMSVSPLNFSDIEYDGNGTTSPHADGEIWSAINFKIREALSDKHNAQFPASDKGLQNRCAEGLLAAARCPGNRRWIQIMHDAFLLQPDAPSMVDSRDAYLAADKMRFGGANQRELWDVFASRGLGETAAATIGQVCVDPVLIRPCPPGSSRESGSDDREPTPGWSSPLRSPATVKFAAAPVGDAPAAERMQVFVGVYEARVTPTADTDPSTDGQTPVDPAEPDGDKRPDIPDTAKFNPGTYEFIARAPGYGAFRFTQTFTAGENATVRVPLRLNLASFHNEAVATGDGGNLDQLIDDTERTNWSSFNEGPVEGKQVTVKLGTGRRTVRQVQVSAALRPSGQTEDPADEREPSDDPSEQPEDDPPYDTGGQNRFSALRQFEILACDTTAGKTCEEEADFTSIYTSPADAFPAIRPRPRSPELTLRPFDVPDTAATHVRIKVLHNQCTGNVLYNGENNPDNDPGNDPDCVSGFSTIGAANTSQERRDNSQAEVIRIAELQVFGDNEPFLGDPCGGAQVASSYLDRGNAREVHQRSIDCVIFRRIAIGQERNGEKFYEPLRDVTRGQMASFIVNDLVSAGHGDKLPGGRGDNQFTDIARDTHRVNINRLARANIISGTGGGRYSPNAKVSREQMATFMVAATRFAIGPVAGNDGQERFGDVAGRNVHKGNIEFGADLGLFSGVTATRFDPEAPVKRDQMASFLINMLRRTAPQFS